MITRLLVPVVPVVLVACLLAGCAADPDPAAVPSPTAGTTSEPAVAPTSTPAGRKAAPGSGPRRFDLPVLHGRRFGTVVPRLRADVRPYWSFREGDAPCGSAPTVRRQRPPAGPVRFGSSVRLEVEVGRCPLTDELRAVADDFVSFARGGPAPAVAGRLLLLVGHDVVAVVPKEEVGIPGAWSGCPGLGLYAARTCPFDFLEVFTRGPVEIATAPPRHNCLHTSRLLPGGLDDLRAVTVTHEGSCVDHAAVRLYVDEAGLLVAADLEMPEP